MFSAKSFAQRLFDLIDTFDSAVRASAAVESGRKPSRAALRRLGIRPDAFDKTGLF